MYAGSAGAHQAIGDDITVGGGGYVLDHLFIGLEYRGVNVLTQ